MKKSKVWLASAFIGCLISLITCAGAYHNISTTPEPMSVTITRPGEGETIYAGPQTMLYSISITGIVHMGSSNPAESELKLEVFSGETRIDLITSRPNANGDFSFPITVNPDKNASELTNGLTLDRNTVCLVCHFAVSRLSLIPGALRIRVTVTAPSGQQAFCDRQIMVDRGGYATVPVKVVLAEDGKTPAVNVRVTGGARLYLWRARYGTAITDNEGNAKVTVEALSNVPTHYVFKVEPVVVNGILYESEKPVEVILPPGAITAAQVTLQVSVRLGKISGSVSSLSGQDKIWAISLPSGIANITTISSKGKFSFTDMKVGEYILTTDPHAMAEQGLVLKPQNIDLTESLYAQVDLISQPLYGASLTGNISSDTGEPLPFAWVSVDSLTNQAYPVSGTFTLFGYPATNATAIISAPGYYSQAYFIDYLNTITHHKNFTLVRRPQTKIIPWGSGTIIIPPETVSSVEGQLITFEQGWLWGNGESELPLVIQWGGIRIMISSGKFALERLPDNAGWLYMTDGQASIQQPYNGGIILVNTGEMVLLNQGQELYPVKCDPVVAEALRINNEVPFVPTWQSSLSAQLRDRAARIGIGTAQVVTFITYLIEVLGILVIPFLGVNWLVQKKKKEKERD